MKKFRKLFFILLALLICGGVTVSAVINNRRLNNIRINNLPSEIARRTQLEMIEPFLEDIGDHSTITVFLSDYNMTYHENYNHNNQAQNVNLKLKQDQQFILNCFKRSKTPIGAGTTPTTTGLINFVFPNDEILHYSEGYFYAGVGGTLMYLIQDHDRENLDNFVNSLILFNKNPNIDD